MRERRRPVPDARSPRLARIASAERIELVTETAGSLPPVYGERWIHREDRTYRSFEPGRSKLAAALVHDWKGPVPASGEDWLYLGAATGTTASHAADLIAPSGRVYAVERSPRSFARLLALAQRWPGLLPILGDARVPREYAPFVPEVRGVYADIAQPDQVAIVRANAELFLAGPGASVVVALKTASMGRGREASEHLADAERALRSWVDLAPSVRLDPFHRGHYLVGGLARAELFGGRGTLRVRPPRAPPRAR